MSSNKWLSSLSIRNDNERKKEKGHLVGYYMMHYTLATSIPFKVVNSPEIALTLEKCLIQGKIIVCFPWIERFFMKYAIFLDIFKLSYVASTKVTRASLWMET